MKRLVLPAALALLCVSCNTLANQRELYQTPPGSGPWTDLYVEKRTVDAEKEHWVKVRRIQKYDIVGYTTAPNPRWWPLYRAPLIAHPGDPLKYEQIGGPEFDY